MGYAASQAMEDSFVASSRYIEQQAVRAVAALAPPSWTAHVIGTAAALVAENARQSCAQQIMHQVCIRLVDVAVCICCMRHACWFVIDTHF